MEHPPRPSPEALNGTALIPYLFVLDELEAAGNGDAGVALWQMLRNVRGRIDAGDELPGILMMGECGELMDAVPELRTTLRGMTRLLREKRPDADTRDGLVLGCAHLGLWAEGMGACRTALCFFALAEEMEPERPHLGYHIGRLARKLALYDLAEPWLKWAHRGARANREWEVAALCVSGLGNLYRQRGNLPLARRFHRLCLRIARRHGLRTLEGDALYDLAGISFDAGEEEEGSRCVSSALRVYGPGHSRVYTLAHDVAWFWMERYGRFARAASLLLELLNHLWEPKHRLIAYAHLARAASGAGWADLYESAWNETWALMRQQTTRDGHAGALTQLALGAGNSNDWDRARTAAREALRIAESRQEGEMVFLAESILAAVPRQNLPVLGADDVFTDRIRMSAPEKAAPLSHLEDDFADAMRSRRDEAPQSPTRALAVGASCR
jgi:tetratricopeptide (TPR) repeat protein